VTGDMHAGDMHADDEEESFGRPFLGWTMPAPAAPPGPAAPVPAAESDEGDEAYRPYLLTGGRTGGGRAGVKIETVLVRDFDVPAVAHTTTPELARIVEACAGPVAVAEVAGRLGLPLGVVQVLAGDLVAAGVLQRSTATTSLADDVGFIERLIQGVASL